jgi:hypothetical protein
LDCRPVDGPTTVGFVAQLDAEALLLVPLEQTRKRMTRLHRLYFFVLKHDLLDPEPNPVRGICRRPLVGPHTIDARMIRAIRSSTGGRSTPSGS